MDYTEKMRAYMAEERAVMDSLDLSAVNELMNAMEDCRLAGKRVFICGNGGSAATASHYVCDFMKGVSLNQEKKYDFECLNDNIPLLMAVANDISYDDVFLIPLKAKLHQGDLVIGISGSGNSENVVRALEYASEHGADTAALVGYDGGKLKKTVRHCVHVKADNMQIVEDLHMMLDHMMMYILSDAEK